MGHTKWPWKLEAHTIDGADGAPIVEYDYGTKEDYALIASAPELLRMLKKVADLLAEDKSNYSSRVYKMAQEAIDKAEGRA